MKLTDLHLVYQYNRWANDRVLGAAAMLPEEELRRDVSTSHGSVWGTLVHIVWGEWLWLGRWEHRHHGPGADPTECCDLASLARRCTEIAAAQRVFLDSLNGAALDRRVAYENPPGVASPPAWCPGHPDRLPDLHRPTRWIWVTPPRA